MDLLFIALRLGVILIWIVLGRLVLLLMGVLVMSVTLTILLMR